jgi:superfamily II DNA or RNA helicase
MRQALNNLNSDLAAQYPDYVCRVTADEGDIGRGHLSRFQDVDTKVPTILTTSLLLTTGVDAPTCKNVVLARVIGSMSEFKQIIGRGTRVRDDYRKLWFNILDYTGSATRLFADSSFDGDPARITEEEMRCGLREAFGFDGRMSREKPSALTGANETHADRPADKPSAPLVSACPMVQHRATFRLIGLRTCLLDSMCLFATQ